MSTSWAARSVRLRQQGRSGIKCEVGAFGRGSRTTGLPQTTLRFHLTAPGIRDSPPRGKGDQSQWNKRGCEEQSGEDQNEEKRDDDRGPDDRGPPRSEVSAASSLLRRNPAFLVLSDFYLGKPPFPLKQMQCLSYESISTTEATDSLTYVVYLSYQKEDEEVSRGPKNPSRMFCH